MDCERGSLWNPGWCDCGLVVGEEEEEFRGWEGLAFLDQAGMSTFSLPLLGEILGEDYSSANDS